MNIFLKNVLTLISGTVSAQVIAIAFVPVLTRLFTPEEFGVFYVFITIATILSIITTGGFETTFVLPKSDDDAKQLFIFSIMLSVSITLVCFLICMFLQYWGNVFFKTESSRMILWLVPVYSSLVGLSKIFKNWSVRGKNFNWVSSSNIIRSGSTGSLQAGFGLLNTGSLGMVFGSCLSQVFPLLFLTYKNKPFLQNITRVTLKKAYIKAKEYKSFPKLMMPTDLLNEFSIQSPVFVLRTVFSNAVVAIYSLPYKIMNQPARFIGQAVSEVYYRQASELNTQDEDIGELTFKTFKNLFLIGIIPFFVTMFWGKEIFSFVFSKEWESSGRIASYLSPWLLFEFAGSPISNILIIRKKLGYIFYMNLLLLIIRVSALLFGALIMKDLQITVILFAGSSLIYWVYIVFFSLKLCGVRIWRIMLFIIATAGISLLSIGSLKLLLT